MRLSDSTLARALAMAFLDGDWEFDPLLDRAAQVLGGRRRWVRRLVKDLLAAFPRTPRDAPSALAGWIGAHPSLIEAAARARDAARPLRVAAIHPGHTEMGRRRWPVATLDDLADLAELLDLDQAHLAWFADQQHRARRAPDGPLHHYRRRWISRSGRTPRLLEVPLPRLRALQRTLTHEVLAHIPTHPAAHGFVRGRGAVTGAQQHVGRDAVLSLDLSAFFASVSAARVRAIWRAAGYPEPVADALTGVVTTLAPVRMLTAMPPGGPPEARALLRAWLRASHLPQGAPTSPALANLAAHRLDARLAGYAAAAGWCYTRYADDLTISGGPEMVRRTDAVVAALSRIVTEEGFRVNPTKTRLRTASQRQLVTGIVVNRRPGPGRSEYDQLKALLHNASRTGGQAQNRDGHPAFAAHVRGRIAWVAQLHPERGARLLATWHEVDWS
ncbi:MAG: RNA-directed DNA polymerase [Kineosporiaceae bacterium]|nr:RNA-directed DNA polymerase [Kineosporiaceae bacterium]MBK7625183.1 RNA-directed DNA polymerase [Kineosporiaceae bacterium]MBK8076437.1 RNA-directed DNA polymerase [Kineosporiaceae bacterium]